jgi:hypothetical protein
MGPIPNGLAVTLNTGLMGQPATPSQGPPAVGPTVEPGTVAMASSGNGLDPGIRYGNSLDWNDWLGLEPGVAELEQERPQPLAPEAEKTAAEHLLVRHEPDADGARADEQALEQAEFFLTLGTRLQSWLGSVTGVETAQPKASLARVATGLAQYSTGTRRGRDNPDRANRREVASAQVDLATTACAVMVGAAACRMRRPLHTWWRRNGRMLSTAPGNSVQSLHRGPHAPLARARATTRLQHKPKALR